MAEPSDQDLLQLADDIRSNAYAPHSGFKVGAALIAANEQAETQVFTGVNVENDSYPAGMCAERVAIGNAVTAGFQSVRVIAVAADYEDYLAPCGMCRQVIYQFGNDCRVVMRDVEGHIRNLGIDELLPMGFHLK